VMYITLMDFISFGNTGLGSGETYCISGKKMNDWPVKDCGMDNKSDDAAGTLLTTTLTDADGDYEFCGLYPVHTPSVKNQGRLDQC